MVIGGRLTGNRGWTLTVASSLIFSIAALAAGPNTFMGRAYAATDEEQQETIKQMCYDDEKCIARVNKIISVMSGLGKKPILTDGLELKWSEEPDRGDGETLTVSSPFVSDEPWAMNAFIWQRDYYEYNYAPRYQEFNIGPGAKGFVAWSGGAPITYPTTRPSGDADGWMVCGGILVWGEVIKPGMEERTQTGNYEWEESMQAAGMALAEESAVELKGSFTNLGQALLSSGACKADVVLPIIFVPGVAGTELEFDGPDIDYDVWPLAPIASRTALALNSDGTRPHDFIKTDDVMKDIGFKYDIYGSFYDFLETKGYEECFYYLPEFLCSSNQNLYSFRYDWRLDNTHHMVDLDNLVDRVLEETKSDKVIIIAHSMGGLISRAYIDSLGRDKVDTLITMGTPWYGAPKPYYGLINGYTFGNPFVRTELMKILMQNYPAAYQLIPKKPFIYDTSNSQVLPLKQSFEDIRYKWFTSVEPDTLSRDDYDETTDNVQSFNIPLLKQSTTFNRMLFTTDEDSYTAISPKPLPAGVDHYLITGTGVSTLTGYGLRDATAADEQFLELGGRKVVLIPIFADGDGTVPMWSLELDGVTATYYVSDERRLGLLVLPPKTAQHMNLGANKDLQNIIAAILEGKPPATQQYSPPAYQTDTEVRTDFILHSDAHMAILDVNGERLGYNSSGYIFESVPGTFLNEGAVEYASVADTSNEYRVMVEGIRDGEFDLEVNVETGDTIDIITYNNVQVKNGTTAEVTLVPNQIAATMPPMIAVTEGETTSIKPQKSSITTTPQPAAPDDNIPIDLPDIDLPENIPGGGECLIATAAFGSELTPQVQFLRNFRDNHILSTTAGSSFMNVFNSWYYSFSPYVADYERGQPWLQQTVKVAIYPLLGILHLSEKAYSAIPGEYGALSAGMVASAMIGALYFSPIALSIKQVRKSKFNYRIAIFIITAASIAIVGSILTGNIVALMVTTSMFVLSIICITAILSGKALIRLFEWLNTSRKQ